ncbi:MAG: electron transfer flavoprotein subunit alpha/FixB family protein [Dehalococcoidia bacterium]|nr:electron transfer flavoprotein subunit alpha/FixB family protein [Dehalococcoidia bacterium]
MSQEVWIFAEQSLGNLLSVSLELLGKGLDLSQRLGGKLAAILVGCEVRALASELMDYGCEKVYVAESPKLSLYQGDFYADLLARLISEKKPEIVLWGATTIGRELAPWVAAKIKTGLTAHCTDLYIADIEGKPRLVQVVPGWGGNMSLEIVCNTNPQMATVKPGLMAKPPQKKIKGEIIPIANDLIENVIADKMGQSRAETIELVEEESEDTPLEEAEVVVAGGWGLNSLGGFHLVEQLAQILEGAVAGTRPAYDKGWIPESRMIGQSGKIVSPRLFISLGASGASQFTTGLEKSQIILAVDQNPKAPIFEMADIGIVGNLQTILPLLIKELNQKRL